MALVTIRKIEGQHLANNGTWCTQPNLSGIRFVNPSQVAQDPKCTDCVSPYCLMKRFTRRFVWSMLHMKPGLMWMGQEAFGISLFDSKKCLGMKPEPG